MSLEVFRHVKNISFDHSYIVNGCKMKLFQQIIGFYQMLGILLPQPNPNYKHKLKTLIFLFSFIQMFMSTGAFFLYEAKSLREHVETLNLPITEIVSAIYILVSKWKMAEILKLCEEFEGFIEKSM